MNTIAAERLRPLRIVLPGMTIRLLEDGYARTLQNDTEDNPALRANQENARKLENGWYRNLQSGATRQMEDALCAACLKCNCLLGLRSLNITIVTTAETTNVTYSVNIYCGNYQGPGSCIAYYKVFLIGPSAEPGTSTTVVWQTTCYQIATPIRCGYVKTFTGPVGDKTVQLHNGWYQVKVAVWNSAPCTGSPVSTISQNWEWLPG